MNTENKTTQDTEPKFICGGYNNNAAGTRFIAPTENTSIGLKFISIVNKLPIKFS